MEESDIFLTGMATQVHVFALPFASQHLMK